MQLKETADSLSPPSSLPASGLDCIEEHLTPASIMYSVIITEKNTKSTRNADEF